MFDENINSNKRNTSGNKRSTTGNSRTTSSNSKVNKGSKTKQSMKQRASKIVSHHHDSDEESDND